MTFDDWTRDRDLPTLGTNAGAPTLPFQKWRHFKEAFAPELIERAIRENPIPVRKCLDPFGGSGTTALACQFLGARPTTIEVNPYLADLIEAKLTTYDLECLERDRAFVLSVVESAPNTEWQLPPGCPKTMVEPGHRNRWIFDGAVFAHIASLLNAIGKLESSSHRRLLRVMLGGILVEISNVVINGKGRRYRGNWQQRPRDPSSVIHLFRIRTSDAVEDIRRYQKRAELSYTVIRDDARRAIQRAESQDLILFSPPYPNSFDYTDVYNLELWVLGYLDSNQSNKSLRQSTLTSHVQISRDYLEPPSTSPLLSDTIDRLRNSRGKLWNANIPMMVGGYFADMDRILSDSASILHDDGTLWLVVGDSQYAGIGVPTAKILAELALSRDLKIRSLEPFRSMRTSAQQGGQRKLEETLLILGKT